MTLRNLTESSKTQDLYVTIQTKDLKFHQKEAFGIFVRDVSNYVERQILKVEVDAEKDRSS